MAVKKAQLHRDEGAFNTYIFRVMKDTLPEEAVSKKAMLTLNHAIADKFEDIMNEARALIVNNKKSTITSKEVETADELKRRIDEAAKFAPIEQLALSPQCGFSSTVHGNDIAVAAQRAKLRLVIDTAREVWGVS